MKEWYGIYKNYLLCKGDSKSTIEKFFKKFSNINKKEIEIVKWSEEEIRKDLIINFDDIEMCEISSKFNKKPITVLDEWIIDKEFLSLMNRLDDFELTIKELGLHKMLDENIDEKFEDALCTVIYKVSKLKKPDTKLYNKFKKSYYKHHQLRNTDIENYIEIITSYYENHQMDICYKKW